MGNHKTLREAFPIVAISIPMGNHKTIREAFRP
jgi:hypothetical protein